jgi:hypothetical protein
MSTVNGIGTMFYGWRFVNEDTAFATEWFTVLYLPLIPLKRCKVNVPERRKPETIASWRSLVGIVTWSPSFSDRYVVVECTPLSIREVATTYLKAFLLLPSAIVAPLFLMLASRPHLDIEHNDTHFYLSIGMFLAWVVYGVCLLAHLLHKARGRE